MTKDEPGAPEEGSTGAVFDTTHWSVVLQAGGEFSAEAQAALENLCRTYWYPLYAYVRRQGHSIEDAQDLTQAFFARLLARNSVRTADRARGRFRTFLLTSLKRFLINEWKQATCQKRGGGCQFISRDAESLETRFQADSSDDQSPDKAYERRWALVLLARVLDRLQTEFVAAERGQVFDELKPFLTGEDDERTYAEIGNRLAMTQGNVKVTVHRLRHRYRELVREEIARTLEDPKAIDEEMQDLFAALSN